MAKTIMMVDEDPSIFLAVEKFLKTKGFWVMCMSDPEEAYHSAQKHKPDLIISDVAMPGLDGFTLLRGLQENKATQNIPLVLLTATDKVADVEKGFSVGALAYILNPIDW